MKSFFGLSDCKEEACGVLYLPIHVLDRTSFQKQFTLTRHSVENSSACSLGVLIESHIEHLPGLVLVEVKSRLQRPPNLAAETDSGSLGSFGRW